jgi:hypothetical protein
MRKTHVENDCRNTALGSLRHQVQACVYRNAERFKGLKTQLNAVSAIKKVSVGTASKGCGNPALNRSTHRFWCGKSGYLSFFIHPQRFIDKFLEGASQVGHHLVSLMVKIEFVFLLNLSFFLSFALLVGFFSFGYSQIIVWYPV